MDGETYKDTFYVFNDGDGGDSISIGFEYTNVTKDSGLVAEPSQFELAPHDSQAVIFSIIPSAVEPLNETIRLNVIVNSKYNLGNTKFSKIYQFRILTPTSVTQTTEIPSEFSLEQNYPNPFNPFTNIKFGIKENTHTSLKIYDLLGREIVTLVDQRLSPGSYNVEFNGTGLSSGTYIYRLSTGSFVSSKKFLLLK